MKFPSHCEVCGAGANFLEIAVEENGRRYYRGFCTKHASISSQIPFRYCVQLSDVEKLEALIELAKRNAHPPSTVEIQACYALFNYKGYEKLGDPKEHKFSYLEHTVQVLRQCLESLDMG